MAGILYAEPSTCLGARIAATVDQDGSIFADRRKGKGVKAKDKMVRWILGLDYIVIFNF